MGARWVFYLDPEDPRAGVRLALAILRYEAKHPPKDLAQRELIKILQYAKLKSRGEGILARIWEKVTGTKLPAPST